ncbi:MAG: tripartite tricarboxylate transporter TctB family protein [Gammaproteobacteria bacterium]|jgi:putative tricarboxylic transport membrane protein|nr:tripartite tricarboxylate transporter TctB family protein [Gammaproteobacteria bacterium]
MASDRIFGLVMAVLALAYIASAHHIQTSFLSDPVGPKAFPMIIGAVGAISAMYLVFRPDPDPEWPVLRTWAALAFAVLVLVLYAFALRPLGFLLPTALAAALLSYQISPRSKFAAIAGICLSVVLFLVFKFALGLGLVAFPAGFSG